MSSFLWFRGIKPIAKSPSLSAQAEGKHILFNRKRKIETGLAVFRGYRLRQKMHYGISTWIFGCCRQNRSVCHLKEASVTVSLHLYHVCCFPTANWKRTSSSRGVLCHQQTGLFRLVLHGEFSLSHAGERPPLLFLCRNNDFSRHVAKSLFTVAF